MATTALTPATTYRSSLYEWVTTTDHKKIGILYVINSFVFFFIGGLLALGVRTQLAVPENKLISPDVYNQLFTLHASLMLFLFVIPMLAGFANYAVPL
ncbi:MAG TPA: cbb3-type cytochrome c oxidase subunit I, partial [Candidatus Limnocylindrales bacterium]